MERQREILALHQHRLYQCTNTGKPANDLQVYDAACDGEPVTAYNNACGVLMLGKKV